MTGPDGWACAKCGSPMYRDLVPRADAVRSAIEATGVGVLAVIHACAECRTFHVVENGDLRRLSAGELFDLTVKCPDEVKAAQEMDLANGTILVSNVAGPWA